MTLAAREALSDCEVAYALLEKANKDDETWRIYWVTCLSLLRAVGHVLDKVDGAIDAKHRAAVNSVWERWKADKSGHAIFWNFIEAERNNLLKQYKFGVDPEPTYVVTEDGNQIVTEEGDSVVTEDDFFRLSIRGFEDEDGRDVIGEAIEWWEDQLEAVETELARK